MKTLYYFFFLWMVPFVAFAQRKQDSDSTLVVSSAWNPVFMYKLKVLKQKGKYSENYFSMCKFFYSAQAKDASCRFRFSLLEDTARQYIFGGLNLEEDKSYSPLGTFPITADQNTHHFYLLLEAERRFRLFLKIEEYDPNKKSWAVIMIDKCTLNTK